jgi:hypothetical protein
MVGVPGRSKGCHACRKQKIACSQERPECAICQKAGRKCPGYQRDRIFINLGPSKDAPKADKLPTRQPGKPLTSPCKHRHGRVHIKPEKKESPVIPDSAFETALVPQRTLTVSAYRQQLLGTFLSGYVTLQTSSSKVNIVGNHWLPMLTELPCVSRALDVAAVAFCTAKLGRVARDKTLVTESLSLYGRGLHELQRALYDRRQMYTDDTLGACILLAMYEVYECPNSSRTGYLSHVAGCERLIQLRGPAAYTHGLGHYIFKSYRFMAVRVTRGSNWVC